MANTLAPTKDTFGAPYPTVVRDAAGTQFVAPAAGAVTTDADGVKSAPQLVAFSGVQQTGAGSAYAQVAAATVVVKNAPGRAVKVIVIAGTGAVTVFDNTAGSGQTIWTKATVAVGDIYALDVPCSIGITVTAAAATTVLVVYS